MPVNVVETHPDYQAALDYLYSFINYENKMPPTPQHARFNLDRLRWLLAALGNPEQHYPKIVVAGTKGKGSTSAMIEAILRSGGYRTGFYSSPHLHSWRERIRVAGAMIQQLQVAAQVERLKPLVERLPADRGAPTTFELATAIALSHFAESNVEIAVLEVGLGGRYDTVNVVTPLLSVITPISFDHMAVLGPTLSEIAYAKAGIIKSGVPVLTGPQEAAALDVIMREAAGAAPLWIAEETRVRRLAEGDDPPVRPYPVPITPESVALRGPHQLANARVTVGAVMLLEEQGLAVPPGAFAGGLSSVRWPARFEVVEGRPRIVIDGAMNGASAARLREALAGLPHDRLIVVLGTSSDKDISAIARELVPYASGVVVTRSRHPRSAPVEDVAAAVEPFVRGPLVVTDDVPPALAEARKLAGDADVICVAGSLFVAAAAREALDLDAEVD